MDAGFTTSPATQTPEPAEDTGAPSTTLGERRPLINYKSEPNSFGVIRRYKSAAGTDLSHDPDGILSLLDLTDTVQELQKPPTAKGLASSSSTYGPFSSKTAFSLADWYWNSTNKSFADFQKLIGILSDPGFSVDDATNVNWRSMFKTLGSNKEDLADETGEWIADDGWKTTTVSIQVPFHSRMKTKGTEDYVSGKLRHRSIVSVIKEKISNPHESSQFHYHPYKATWRPNNTAPLEVELYGEFYLSREFRSAHEELQKLALPGPNSNLTRVVVALMFWSDATHLTSFGTAYLWPCYLFFGNESKYRRCKPSESLGNHIAYFEKLPDIFMEYLKERNHGKIPPDALLSHCAREAYHSQWKVLLDSELLDAMKHGIRIDCPDGEPRLFFPRVFTCSADYPEKALLAGIRNNGLSPCHRCLVAKSDLYKLGGPSDTERGTPRPAKEHAMSIQEARREIFQGGYAVGGSKIEEHLKAHSLVPTINSFELISDSQLGHPFTIFNALAVDLMHEFEIGVWKRLYIHLIRILHAFSTTAVTLTAELDSRYRATPSFGRDTIRKFGVNASDMKRKAARDFEDLLQCSIPAFEALIPEPHNAILMSLLYICAEWHALAKLRLHNDFTLAHLEYTTIRLGAQMRRFDQDTCSRVQTKELPKEADARVRREGGGKETGASSRKPASLGIFTIKFHYLGDYVSEIRQRGTTDSYSTETGELAHRKPKSWYGRTDKKDFKAQMTQVERRQARLARIRSEMTTGDQETSEASSLEKTPQPSPDSRYAIGTSQNEPIELSRFSKVIGVRPDPYIECMRHSR